MPPKKAEKPSKKTELKKKEKIIEDKTFGLKNKKGGKAQKFIAQVEKQVKSGGDPKSRRIEEERLAEKKRREEEKKKLEEERALFKPVQGQKVESGADPKSVFCAFFKQGLCKKGDKCKFSHDPNVERRAAKRSIYADEKKEEDETMDDWDEDKLQDVVAKKHGGEKSNQTDIICKYFLDALENNKYGWFWVCPNGGNECKYRHALPPGFQLKKDKKSAEKEDTITIEELIEQKRAELSARTDLTPVTLQTFVLWKKKKLKEKADNELKEAESKKDKYKAGLTIGLSGREMFSFNPKMVGDEDDEDDGEAYDLAKVEREAEDDYGVKVHEIKFDMYGIMDDGLDDTTESQLQALKQTSNHSGVDVDGAAGAIDEDLFDDEDLEELEENLENLEV